LSGTNTVAIYKCRLPERLPSIGTFYLVDTPGFDDTHKTDADVLKDLAAWLNASYGKGILLTGIIYLHPIDRNRVGGAALQNLLMFQKLCGDQALTRVVLATTFWDAIDKDLGKIREEELTKTDKFWRTMIQKGSKVFRHDDFDDSAGHIIRYLVNKRTPKNPLAIQIEMVDEHKALNETGAGSTLQAQLLALQAAHERKIDELKKELKAAIKANNVILMAELEEDRLKYSQEREKSRLEQQKLQADNEDLKKRILESQGGFEQDSKERGDSIRRWEHELRTMQLRQEAEAEKRKLQEKIDEEKKKRQHLLARIKQAQSCWPQ
jgi:hypothetical protein